MNQRPAGPLERSGVVTERPWPASLRSPPGRVHPQGECVSLTTEREFLAVEPLWRELFAEAHDASPFLSWDFTVEWLRNFVLSGVGSATGRFEMVLAFDARRRLIGAVPMFEETSLGSAASGLVLQPFGRSQSLETMTDEPIILLRRGSVERAAQTIAEHVAARLGAAARDSATIPGWPLAAVSDKPSFRWMQRLKRIEVTRPVTGTLAVSLPQSWDVFRAGLSKSMRDNIAYYPRRLEREVGNWTIRTARSPSEIAVAVEHLIALHNERSRAKTGVAHRSHITGAKEAAFLRSWFARAAARREVSIVSIDIGGSTIATQAFVEMPGCISVYYSGYGEQYYRYSPLTIITAHVIRSAIERGVDRLEFPPIPTPWKLRWGAVARPVRSELSIYATTLPALVRGLFRRLRA